MAKKNIISDFSALKGKVTFSELSSVATAELGAGICACPAKPSSTPKEQHKDQAAGRVLKVGQKVVLMDSDLRGKIVSLGRTVGIELEDGLVIKAAYGEFAVTHTDEITALKQSRQCSVLFSKTHAVCLPFRQYSRQSIFICLSTDRFIR